MSLKLKDEFIEADLKLGPMPDFNGSFERFFIEKAANLIYGTRNSSSSSPASTSSYENDEEYIVIFLIFNLILLKLIWFNLKSIEELNDLHWMRNISLANNKLEQNLEIIYNDKNVYFKTLRTIFKNEDLLAFPSKDLEISLGLQFIPISSGNKTLYCLIISTIYKLQFLCFSI